MGTKALNDKLARTTEALGLMVQSKVAIDVVLGEASTAATIAGEALKQEQELTAEISGPEDAPADAGLSLDRAFHEALAVVSRRFPPVLGAAADPALVDALFNVVFDEGQTDCLLASYRWELKLLAANATSAGKASEVVAAFRDAFREALTGS
jgi:hypothetical protein